VAYIMLQEDRPNL